MRIGVFASLLGVWLCVSPAHAEQAAEDAIVGTWLTEQQDSQVEIIRSGATYVGKVSWLKEPQSAGKPVTDVKNTDVSLRGRPILGLDILTGFSYAGDRTWRGGSIYAPRKGRSYPAELSLSKDGRLDVKVKDGVLPSMYCGRG